MESNSDEDSSTATLQNVVQRKLSQWRRPYRILIAATITASMVVLMALSLTGSLSTDGALTAVAVHVFFAVFIRNDEVVNCGFTLIAHIPSSSLPYSLRRRLGNFHHYGGLHAGSAISAIAWYTVFGIKRTRECIHGGSKPRLLQVFDLTTCWMALFAILSICIFSISRFRVRFHNFFERTHRFMGWLSIVVLWTNAMIRTQLNDPNTQSHMLNSPVFWLLLTTTLFLILPWTRIRRVPIHSAIMSGREIRLSFPYDNMPYCRTMRFSLAPLTEWHAFATIPAADGLTADILVAGVGDWTQKIVASPPQQMWLRKPPVTNFLSWITLFDSVLLVGTGSGIGPLLSLLRSPKVADMKGRGETVRVMWSTRDPDAEWWDFAKEIILSVDQAPVLFDTRHGRPDVACEARKMAQKEGVEAVMVVSNRKVTDEVVLECQSAGIAAYGAVFDS